MVEKEIKTHLEGPEQGHVVTEGTAAEACATVQSSSSVGGMIRQAEGVLVGQRAGYSQNRVQTLQHYSTQHHLPQVGLDGEVSQVESQLGQLLMLVHGIHGLNTRCTKPVIRCSSGCLSVRTRADCANEIKRQLVTSHLEKLHRLVDGV